jgi:hypothetical protein
LIYAKKTPSKISRLGTFKETVARDLLPPIFFHDPQPDCTIKNMPKIAEMKLSICGLEVAASEKIAIAELRSCGCGATFL